LQDEVLILGGGVAGCAASIALARKGQGVTLIEREPTPRHKVCGEFLSGEALEEICMRSASTWPRLTAAGKGNGASAARLAARRT
jgi:flavin-dependent dehydrogenase